MSHAPESPSEGTKPPTEDLMTPAEFGARIRKSYDWVIRNYHGIPHLKIGRSIFFTEKDLAEYLERSHVTPPRPRTKGWR